MYPRYLMSNYPQSILKTFKGGVFHKVNHVIIEFYFFPRKLFFHVKLKKKNKRNLLDGSANPASL